MKILLYSVSFFLILPVYGMEVPLSEVQNNKLVIEWAAAMWQNHRYRDFQEDKVLCARIGDKRIDDKRISDNSYFFGVFDGHGSFRTDGNVSSLLKERLHYLFVQSKKETIQEKLEEAFEYVEKHVLQCYSDGSTALVAYIDNKYMLHIAWAGDSRAVLEKNKTIAYETKDHDPFSNPSERKRIKEKGMYMEDNYIYADTECLSGITMTRSIGDKLSKGVTPEKPLGLGGIIATPEYYSIQLTPENNFLIMATDGLWYDVTSDQAVALAASWRDNVDESVCDCWIPPMYHPDNMLKSSKCNEWLPMLTRELGIIALKRGSRDNIAVLMVQLNWSTVPEIEETKKEIH